MPQSDEAPTLLAVKQHFEKLSLEYGYKILPTEKMINSIGYYYLGAKNNPKMAIEIFEHNVKTFPESANALDSLADALEADGKIELALEKMSLAITISDKLERNYLAYKAHHKRLKLLMAAAE